MKTPSSIRIPSIVSGYLATATILFAQGSLTPPGPPAPAMKSLAQIEPRTPIPSLPFTITNSGSYYLTTNLTGVSGANGITVAANNVTIDLSGFALFGVSNSQNAILVNTYETNVTVRNGSISGWGSGGVNGYSGAVNSLCERLTVSGCSFVGISLYNGSVSDCAVSSCGNDGINLSLSGTVSGCTVLSCNGNGVYVENGIVSGCSVQSCNNYAISGYSATVSGCLIVSCNEGINVTLATVSGSTVLSSSGFGISIGSGTVSGCQVRGNAHSGIEVGYNFGSGSVVTGNVCFGNNTSGSSSDAGINVFYTNNRVEDNNVMGSGFAGIAVNAVTVSSNNVIVRNTVSGNGANNYVTPGSQIVGPLITTTGTITSASPWANFSF